MMDCMEFEDDMVIIMLSSVVVITSAIANIQCHAHNYQNHRLIMIQNDKCIIIMSGQLTMFSIAS